MATSHLRSEWAPNVTRELLAGTVVALALIPEAIAFSIIAGVDPKVFDSTVKPELMLGPA